MEFLNRLAHKITDTPPSEGKAQREAIAVEPPALVQNLTMYNGNCGAAAAPREIGVSEKCVRDLGQAD
jgi:hypothetical protein